MNEITQFALWRELTDQAAVLLFVFTDVFFPFIHSLGVFSSQKYFVLNQSLYILFLKNPLVLINICCLPLPNQQEHQVMPHQKCYIFNPSSGHFLPEIFLEMFTLVS